MQINWNKVQNGAGYSDSDYGVDSTLGQISRMNGVLQAHQDALDARNRQALDLSGLNQFNRSMDGLRGNTVQPAVPAQVQYQVSPSNAVASAVSNTALGNAALIPQLRDSGLSNTFIDRLVNIESGGRKGDDPYLNQRGYRGKYQIGQGYLDDFNKAHKTNYKLDDMMNDELASKVFNHQMGSYVNQMKKYGLPVNDTTAYLAHNQGVGGLRQIIGALEGGQLTDKIRSNIWNNLTKDTKQAIGGSLDKVDSRTLANAIYNQFNRKMVG